MAKPSINTVTDPSLGSGHSANNTTAVDGISDKATGLDFSTVMASSVHDMKNSLSMLLCTLDELMQVGGAPAENEMTGGANALVREKYTQLHYEGQRLNNHLIQLLAIYRIDQAQYSANVGENDVEEFLEESVLQFEPLLTPKGIEIHAICEEGLIGYFDRELVAGVINNIVNNAYKYSKDKIRLVAALEGGYTVISVEDNGAGYPQQMLCETSSVPGSIDFSTGSTGLGLYFSSLVASLHRNKEKVGYIRCSNDGIDGGGRFSIYIP